MARFTFHPRIAITVILVVAAILRLYDVNQPYVDAYAWRQANTALIADGFARGDWNIFLPRSGLNGPGPDYVGAEFQIVSYVAAIGYQLFGAAPWVGRSVSVAFGLWGIFALYQLVRRIWDEPRAILAATVMAVLPGSVFIERSFLPDGAMTALMTTSLWMLVVWCDTQQTRHLALAAAFGAFGCLTKLPGGILIIPAFYVLWALLGNRLFDSQVYRRLGIAAMAVVGPVLAYYLWARHLSLTYPPYHFFGEDKFLWDQGITAWVEKGYYLPQLWGLLVSKVGLWGYPFTFAALFGLVILPAPIEHRKGFWLFHFWVIALCLRYLLEAYHLVSDPYNLHLFNVAVSVFAAQALVALWQAMARVSPTWIAGTITLCLLGSVSAYGQYHLRPLFAETYHDHYALGSKLNRLAAPDDLVVAMGLEPVVLYYSRRRGWIFPPLGAWNKNEIWDYGTHDVALLENLISEGASWVAIPSWNNYTGGGADRKFLQKNYPTIYEEIIRRFEMFSEEPFGSIYRLKPDVGKTSAG